VIHQRRSRISKVLALILDQQPGLESEARPNSCPKKENANHQLYTRIHAAIMYGLGKLTTGDVDFIGLILESFLYGMISVLL
jgi:hypothetical protein